MPTEHVDIIDGERHEPKGADSASAGASYVSDGAQSGNWSLPIHYFAVTMDDIGGDDAYLPVPIAGDIVYFQSVLHEALTVADATIDLKIGTVAVTGGQIVITQAASAVGDVDSATPTALNTVAVGDYLHLDNDLAATGGAVTFIIGIQGAA